MRFIGLGKTYNGQQGPVAALHGIDLAIQRGEVFGIIGRSGAGKSSLIRTINRLEQPSTGRVLIDQVDIGEFDEDRLVALRRRIGMIFQHFNLMSAKTVWQNVELPLKVAGVPKEKREQKVRELLELVGLQEKHKAYPAQLSGGQKQRVGIARALVHDPAILLCDEATSALDPETTQSILGLLREINQRLGLTIVLITHEMAVIRDICDRVVVLEHGRIVEQGPVWEVFGNPQHEVSKTLLAPLQHAFAGRTAKPFAGAATVLGRRCCAALAIHRQRQRRTGPGRAVQRPRRSRALAARWRGTDSGPCPRATAAGGDRFVPRRRGIASTRRQLGATGGGAGLCGLIACCKASSTPS